MLQIECILDVLRKAKSMEKHGLKLEADESINYAYHDNVNLFHNYSAKGIYDSDSVILAYSNLWNNIELVHNHQHGFTHS